MAEGKLVEITGVGFHNQGAHLMLLSVRREVNRWNDDSALGLAVDARNFRRGAELGLTRIVRKSWGNPTLKQRLMLGALNRAPAALRRGLRLADDDAVSAVLDASGFALGDQWGPVSAEDRARVYRRRRETGVPVVLLPQALGPFSEPLVRHAAIAVFKEVDLIYARDSVSLEHCQPLVSEDKLRLAPDFTVLLPAAQISDSSRLDGAIVVIPNQRMMDKTPARVAANYRQFLGAFLSASVDLDREVVILLHDLDDFEIAASLRQGRRRRVRVVHESDPTKVKAMLEGPAIVLSSRFHGLVSAMSQGTPAIGTGWSHKYAMLFSDYGCPDDLWRVDKTDSEIRDGLERMLDPSFNSERKSRLLSRSQLQVQAAQRMWGEVRSSLDREQFA